MDNLIGSFSSYDSSLTHCSLLKHPNVEPQVPIVSNPVIRRMFIFLRYLGCIISLASLSTEVLYLFSHIFHSVLLFSLYAIICIVKAIIPMLIALISYKRFVIGIKPNTIM